MVQGKKKKRKYEERKVEDKNMEYVRVKERESERECGGWKKREGENEGIRKD